MRGGFNKKANDSTDKAELEKLEELTEEITESEISTSLIGTR